MSEPLSIPAQARALRGLTGIPLAHCRRIIAMAAAERQKAREIKRRAARAPHQLELAEQPLDDATISEGFARIRETLAMIGRERE